MVFCTTRREGGWRANESCFMQMYWNTYGFSGIASETEQAFHYFLHFTLFSYLYFPFTSIIKIFCSRNFLWINFHYSGTYICVDIMYNGLVFLSSCFLYHTYGILLYLSIIKVKIILFDSILLCLGHATKASDVAVVYTHLAVAGSPYFVDWT